MLQDFSLLPDIIRTLKLINFNGGIIKNWF